MARADGISSPPGAALMAGAVLFLAAVLRLPHLGYGLPGTTYVDAFRFVEEAHRMATSPGPFEPNDFVYPGLLKVLLALIYKVFGVEDRVALHLVPRVLASLFDLGTVALVFALARRLTSGYGATLAAALHAVSVIAVTSARVETADSALTFFLAAALWTLTAPELRLVHFAFGGLLVGCAAGTKYTGAYGLWLLPAAAWISYRRATSPALSPPAQPTPKPLAQLARDGGGAALGVGVAVLAFLASTPWFIPMFGVYWKVITIQAEVQRFGQIGHVQSSVFDYLISSAPTWEEPWLASSLLYNLGPLALVAGLGAIAAALAGKLEAPARLLAIFVVGFYLLVAGAGHVKAIRYLLPVLPALSVLTAAAVVRLIERSTAELVLQRQVAEVLAALALLAYPTARTLRYLDAAARPMTNDLVFAWARQGLPRGATVLLSPFYLENLRGLDVKILEISGAATNQYRANNTLGNDSEEKPVFRPELLGSMKRSGIEYVVLSSYFEGAVYDTEENRRWFPKTVAAYRAFREALDASAEQIYAVRGEAEHRLGPDIEVYRLRPPPTSTGLDR